MPANPFISSSRRKQILIPKELFPLTRATANPDAISSSFRRPVKLPLRKHHSFHFSTSQTVSGAIKHEQFQQKHATETATNRQIPVAHEQYKSQGPLVFKPLGERSEFKPITPSPIPIDQTSMVNGASDCDESTIPRICGTSLKRHISNVETFSSPQWQNDDKDNNQPVIADNIRRKIHYADLVPLQTVATSGTWKNERNLNGISIDGNISEKRNRRSSLLPLKTQSESNVKKPTQYATLRFDEVNIDI